MDFDVEKVKSVLEAIVSVPGLDKAFRYGAERAFDTLLARVQAHVEMKRAQKGPEVPQLQEGRTESPQIQPMLEGVERLVPLLQSQGMSVQGKIGQQDLVGFELHFHEKQQLNSVVDFVGQAAEELKGREIPDEELDHRWNGRIFTDVKDVTDADVRKLYGKVLAGQIERPGSFSLKALDVLQSLDQPTAKLLQTLCSACMSMTVDGNSILNSKVPALEGNAGTNTLQKYGLSFDQLNRLNEHGLIISDYNASHDYRSCIWPAGTDRPAVRGLLLRFQGRLWALEALGSREPETELRVHGVVLTQAGQELSAVVDIVPMAGFAQELERFFKGHEVRMVPVKLAPPAP